MAEGIDLIWSGSGNREQVFMKVGHEEANVSGQMGRGGGGEEDWEREEGGGGGDRLGLGGGGGGLAFLSPYKGQLRKELHLEVSRLAS